MIVALEFLPKTVTDVPHRSLWRTALPKRCRVIKVCADCKEVGLKYQTYILSCLHVLALNSDIILHEDC
jgi:hypothetical protein